MPQDLYIDPVTRDMVDDGEGGWVLTDDVSTMALHALQDNLNQWAGAPDQGSLLYLLEQANASDATMRQADAYARDALRFMVDAGKIRDLKVEVDRDQVRRAVLVISFTDVTTGGRVGLNIKPWGP